MFLNFIFTEVSCHFHCWEISLQRQNDKNYGKKSWSWARVIRVIITSIALFQFQLSDTKGRQAAGTSSKYLTMNLKMLMTIAGYQRDQRGIIKFCKNPDSPVPSHYIRLVMLDCPSPRWEFSAVISWYSHLSLNRITVETGMLGLECYQYDLLFNEWKCVIPKYNNFMTSFSLWPDEVLGQYKVRPAAAW